MTKFQKKYVSSNYVQTMNLSSKNELLLSTNGINFLKLNNSIIINKYLSDHRKILFPYNLNPYQYDSNLFYYNFIYEIDKPYINIGIDDNNQSFNLKYCFKKENNIYFNDIPIEINKNSTTLKYLFRDEIENIFNPFNYDSMIIIDFTGNISFIYQKDDFQKGKHIIPTDSEIIDKEYLSRLNLQKINSILNNSKSHDLSKRTIDGIKNFKIDNPLNKKLPNLLLTVKNNQISATYIDIEFLEKDLFKLTYTNPVNFTNIKETNTNNLELCQKLQEPIIKKRVRERS